MNQATMALLAGGVAALLSLAAPRLTQAMAADNPLQAPDSSAPAAEPAEPAAPTQPAMPVAAPPALDTQPAKAADPPAKAAGRPLDLGIIFNINNPLQNLESYQGGLGIKAMFGEHAVRTLVNISFDSTAGSFAVNLGAAYEYHLFPEPVSPYLGLAAKAGYMRQDSNVAVVPISAGAVLGAEIFILDFLSVFAEYEVSFSASWLTDLTSSVTTTNYWLSTGLGNDGKIGIVLYFQRARKG